VVPVPGGADTATTATAGDHARTVDSTFAQRGHPVQLALDEALHLVHAGLQQFQLFLYFFILFHYSFQFSFFF
jgi:hypothetical protein